MKKGNEKECCEGHGLGCCRQKRFPVIAVFLFIVSLVWLLNDLHVLDLNLPWFPLAILLVSIGLLANRYCLQE